MSAERPLRSIEPAEPHCVYYRLDADDRIEEVSGDWSLLTDDPIGQPIWRYVRGTDVQALYAHIFDHVRRVGRFGFPYRCDSTTHCHRIEMSLEKLNAGGLAIQSRRVESLKRARPLRVQAVDSGYAIALRCSVCNFFGRRGDWEDIVELAKNHAWFDRDEVVRVHYSICPACTANIRRQLSG